VANRQPFGFFAHELKISGADEFTLLSTTTTTVICINAKGLFLPAWMANKVIIYRIISLSTVVGLPDGQVCR
jgi:hypothetical protein